MKATLLASAALSLLTVSAFGADMEMPPIKAPLAPPPFTWTGCYAGGQAGGGFGQKDLTDSVGIVSPLTGFTSANLNINGYMLGGQIGCDYQFASNWVVGIEGAAVGGEYRRKHQRRNSRHCRRQRDLQGNDGLTDQRNRACGLHVGSLVALRQRRRRLGERSLQRVRRGREL